MGKYRAQRNYGCRIHDRLAYFGMGMVVLENDLVRVAILIDKGTEIVEYLYKPKDMDFIWLSENGVGNPRDYLPTSPDPVSTFIDYYPGGWQEVFPNGGPTSAYLGAQFGQHGEVAHMPWDYEIVDDRPERISVRFSVRTKKVPFRLEKRLTLNRGSATLQVQEQIENLSDVPLRYMWGQHLAFGRPFLAPGCRIRLPEGVEVLTEAADSPVLSPGRVVRGGAFVWPTGVDRQAEQVDLSVLPDRNTASEMLYIHGFDDQAWYTVENPSLGLGMKVEWDGAAFPYLWYWQEFGATKGYPWYGRHYNVGLEPFAGYPTHGLEQAIANGSAGSIAPGGRATSWWKTAPHEL